MAHFILEPNGTVSVSDDSQTYTDTLTNCLHDLATIGHKLVAPDLGMEGGMSIKAVGFILSDTEKAFILQDGTTQFPIPEGRLPAYQPYLDIAQHVVKLLTAQTSRHELQGITDTEQNDA